MPGRALARTGLRMMPTFPPLPLKFRTAGFPQYGFKAGISDGPSCRPRGLRIEQFASILRAPRCLQRLYPRSESRGAVRWCTTVQACNRLTPRGPRSGPGYSVPVHHAYSTPSVPLAGTARFHRRAAYTRCPRSARTFCAEATPEWFRAFAGRLSRHVALRDPGKLIGCIHPVPSPTTLAFNLE